MINSALTKQIDYNYPCLMKFGGFDQTVVLMTKKGVGSVVHSGNQKEIGDYSNNWNMENFVYCDESVTLTNNNTTVTAVTK